ncbi:phage antirepressor [Thermoanaerobacterium sp. CMT5567-10]|uniref:phage antirepressor n=1 Tax=Thermoanaerobacterium sp. CMT5567-10 TaxID=3061989 RepID=UPI0026E04AE5|nr:phage antirepressor [Thermoanaerobacterium sp. CMT5567-10]WKV08164.1 phage antirepressor [Thermoanaerobacterium sp. CMT5567-10]
MNDLQIFSNKEFGQVRVIIKDNEPWFVGKDVAEVLGYSNTRDALAKHIDEDDKSDVAIYDGSQNRNMTIINESGLYSLVLSSKLPTAKRFKKWITSEVIPSIRKHGAYLTPEKIEEVLLNPDTIIQLATQLKQEREEKLKLEEKIKQDKPKVLFADSVAISDTAILIGELAKLLKQNGIDIGEKRLFEWMRSNGYLISRKGTDYNMPTQKSMELGLFRIKETSITHSDGHVTISKTAKVTGKGQIYFINKFKSMQEINKENVQ